MAKEIHPDNLKSTSLPSDLSYIDEIHRVDCITSLDIV